MNRYNLDCWEHKNNLYWTLQFLSIALGSKKQYMLNIFQGDDSKIHVTKAKNITEKIL